MSYVVNFAKLILQALKSKFITIKYHTTFLLVLHIFNALCIAHSISHTVLSSNRMPEPDPMLFVNYVNKAMSTPQTDVTYRKYIILFILFVVLPVWLSSKYLDWTGIVKS